MGAKLHRRYDGPFLVSNVNSQHLVTLNDPTGKKTFSHPIHLNRLKLAHMRNNFPMHPFQDKIEQPIPHSTRGQTKAEPRVDPVRRSERLQNKLSSKAEHIIDFSFSSDNDVCKIKKVLGQRSHDGLTYYLVHLRGEPSTQGSWVKASQLDYKAKQAIKNSPPPILDVG